MKFCHSCGQSNEDAARFCEKCGTPIGTGQAAPAQPQQPVEVQALVDKSVGALRGIDRRLVIAGVLLLAAMVAGYVFFRPMSTATYDDKADEYVQEINDAASEIPSALESYRSWYSGWDGTQRIDASDWKATREDVETSLNKIRKAAKGIASLRPPKEYRSADERLNRWAQFWLTDYVKSLEQKLNEIKPNDRYEQVDRALNRFDTSVNSKASRAYTQLRKAAEDVGITMSEGE